MQVSVTCKGCDEVLPAGRTDRRYCSAACRQRSYRSRQRGEEVSPPLATTSIGIRPSTGRQGTITVTEAVSNITGYLMRTAVDGVGELEHLDLSATDPAVAAQGRDELALALAMIRRLHAALDAVAQDGDA